MRLLGGCDDKNTCPRIYDENEDVFVQGVHERGSEVLDVTNPGAEEAVVRIPRAVFLEAMRRIEEP